MFPSMIKIMLGNLLGTVLETWDQQFRCLKEI